MIQMSFCTDCGKFCYEEHDNYCAQCGSKIEKKSSSRGFSKKQIAAFNDPSIREELCKTEAGSWMIREAAREGLIKDPKISQSILGI